MAEPEELEELEEPEEPEELAELAELAELEELEELEEPEELAELTELEEPVELVLLATLLVVLLVLALAAIAASAAALVRFTKSQLIRFPGVLSVQLIRSTFAPAMGRSTVESSAFAWLAFVGLLVTCARHRFVLDVGEILLAKEKKRK